MITREKLEHHVTHLEEKLKVLKAECKEAYAQGSDLDWEKLKKKKLRLKDEIETCKTKLALVKQNEKNVSKTKEIV